MFSVQYTEYHEYLLAGKTHYLANFKHIIFFMIGGEDLKAKLLLNSGPQNDGSIHPNDIYTLIEVGKLLK